VYPGDVGATGTILKRAIDIDDLTSTG